MRNQEAYDKLVGMVEFVDGKPYWTVTSHGRKVKGKMAGKIERGYRNIGTIIAGKATIVRAHRLCFYQYHGFLPDILDHCDGNRDNNTISNLRPASVLDNNANRKANVGGSSKYKGVARKGDLWRVKLSKIELGYYQSEVDAAMTYDEVSKWIYGGFAWLNSDHFDECTG